MATRRSGEDEALDPATPAERLWALALGEPSADSRFEVVLTSMWPEPFGTIHALQAKLGLGLGEAKTMAEGAPSRLAETASPDEAAAWVRALSGLGDFTVQAGEGTGVTPIARLVAQNAGAPTALLERLSLEGNEAVSQALVRNPSCPMHVLVWLGRTWAELLLENPLVPLSLLEDPKLPCFRPIHRELFEASNAFPLLRPTAFLVEPGRCHLATHRLSSLSDAQVDAFSRDASENVRARIGGNQETPAAILVRLSGDDDKDVRAAVASNPQTPEYVLERLADDEGWRVRDALSKNAAAPAEARARAARSLG